VSQLGLFDVARGKTETSADAARKIEDRAQTLREHAFSLIANYSLIPYYGGLIADEVAGLMGEDILAIRPRVSELVKMGAIEDTGRRRLNQRGNSQRVWRRSPSFKPQ